MAQTRSRTRAPSSATRTSTSWGRTRTRTIGRTTATTRRRSHVIVTAVSWSAVGARRAGEALRTARDWCLEVITPAGWLVVVAALAGTIIGWALGWVEWLVAGLAAVVLIAVTVPFLFGNRAHDVSVKVDRDRVVAGGSASAEVIVRNSGARPTLPGRIELPVGDGLIEVDVPFLRAGHESARTLEIPTPRRGIIQIGPAVEVRSDPVGLFRRERAWDDRHELYVHPRIETVPTTSAGLIRDLEGQPSRRIVNSDISFHAIREYVPGDSRRHVHWKSTAKTGRLMVRQYEETLRSRTAVILSVDPADYLDADEFELAVSAAASLGVRVLHDGRDLEVVTGVELPPVVPRGMTLIERIPSISPRTMLDGFSGVDVRPRATPIEQIGDVVAEDDEAVSLAFLVVGSVMPLRRLQRAALAFPADTAVIAVLCDEHARPRVQAVTGLTTVTIAAIQDLGGLLVKGGQS
ncbi:DUF58 domain-containing protein [Microbacterium sp. Marseille-Q6965]|uniref:DUF58 domain-containing protein n=1 Tax=Microbacterium sp. Marseille-Q6965 TaxID=2965072 RepID=UPI0021B7B85A|nr:DUF58 domain-containing protein [Microbacterium sp. Marseille-Q6965]